MSVPAPSLAVSGEVILTGSIAFGVPQPSLAVTGLVLVPVTGTTAFTVPQPALAVTGTITVLVTGTVGLTVPTPLIAVSGSVFQPVTGTVAFTVPAPILAVAGSLSGVTPPVLPGVGGGPRRFVLDGTRTERRVPRNVRVAVELSLQLPTLRLTVQMAPPVLVEVRLPVLDLPALGVRGMVRNPRPVGMWVDLPELTIPLLTVRAQNHTRLEVMTEERDELEAVLAAVSEEW